MYATFSESSSDATYLISAHHIKEGTRGREVVSVARLKRQDVLLQQGDTEIADRDPGLPQEVFDKMFVRCQVSGVRVSGVRCQVYPININERSGETSNQEVP